LTTAELENLAQRIRNEIRKATKKQTQASQLQAEAEAQGKCREARRHEYEAGKAKGKLEWAQHKLQCIEDELDFRKKHGDA
jgi:hypothetical protein